MDITDQMVQGQIELALMEDVGRGDITTLACISKKTISAELVAKSSGVLAGVPIAAAVFHRLDNKIKVSTDRKDSDLFSPGDKILSITGDSHAILTGERTALNFLGHLSGVATLTSKFVKKVAGTKAKILDTRKTIPGMRFLDKYAVTCGGGINHRFGLYDMVLIKDNHITAVGTIRDTVSRVDKFTHGKDFQEKFYIAPDELEIEVEIETLAQLKEAIGSGVKRLLLDNQSIDRLSELVLTARKIADNLILEASGNVNLDNVADIARTGVDYISIGALTHSAPSSDFSLNIL
jgi:nicotinate-nucleotide pyrophosphorylase (carboxylating)